LEWYKAHVCRIRWADPTSGIFRGLCLSSSSFSIPKILEIDSHLLSSLLFFNGHSIWNFCKRNLYSALSLQVTNIKFLIIYCTYHLRRYWIIKRTHFNFVEIGKFNHNSVYYHGNLTVDIYYSSSLRYQILYNIYQQVFF
jgi:hypothetical protein